MNDTNFWDNKETANETINKLNNLKDIFMPFNTLDNIINSNIETLNLINNEEDELYKIIEEE